MAQGPYLLSSTQEEDFLIVEEMEQEEKQNNLPAEQDTNQFNEQLIVSRFGIDLTQKHMSRLKPGCWINDNLINFYLELIRHRSITNSALPRVVTFNTQFYEKLSKDGVNSVKEWTQIEDIFDNDVLLIPLHLSDHWSLVVVKPNQKRLLYYDSLHGDGSDCLTKIKEYLQSEASTKGRLKLDPMNWLGLDDKVYCVPKQTNGCDCGVFMCQFAESASREMRPSCKQEQMNEKRKEMAVELQARELLRKKIS